MASQAEWYLLKKRDGGEATAISLAEAYELFVKMASGTVPPFEIYEAQYASEWLVAQYGVETSIGDSSNVLEDLTEAQQQYELHYRQTKSLKAQRELLIRIALKSGKSIEDIERRSGQSVFDISTLAEKIDELPETTAAELEHRVALQKSEIRKKAARAGKAKGQAAQDWLAEWSKLKDWKKQMSESKKKHEGDSFYGTDFTQDQYDELVQRVENTLVD